MKESKQMNGGEHEVQLMVCRWVIPVEHWVGHHEYTILMPYSHADRRSKKGSEKSCFDNANIIK